MSRLIIFGAGDIADVAHFYFQKDSPYKVAAFTVDRAYLGEEVFNHLPVLPFDEVAERFPPTETDMFIAVSYARLNSVRKEKYLAAKSAGYRLATYVSSRATTWPGFMPGENCLILEDNTIQPFASMGNNVTLWSGNHIGHHSRIGSHCFVSSHVVISGGVEVGEQCFIGVNATVRDHVRIGERCVIGAGALIVADAEPEGIYAPAGTERSRVPSSRLRNI